jgi:Uma2 family endonuclease
MRMSSVPGLFTRADYDLLPEGFPAQLVDGDLVKEPGPTPYHQTLTGRLYRRLVDLVGEGRVVIAPIDVGLDEHNVYQPDVVVLRSTPPQHVRDVGVPLLAIEVLSPTSARRDRRTKCPRLLAAGAAEVWLVDPETQVVERNDASGRRAAKGTDVLASDAVPGFEVVPAALFAPPR